MGKERLEELSGGDLDSAKKALGYLVAVELMEMFGADRVMSERGDEVSRAYSRPNDSGAATWVTTYSRHRVVQ